MAPCVRRSDVSPAAVSVRKGPRAAGPRQTLFTSDVTTSRPGAGGSGGVWEGGKKQRSAKLHDKGRKKSRPTIAGVNPQIKAPAADSTLCHRHRLLTGPANKINEPGGSNEIQLASTTDSRQPLYPTFKTSSKASINDCTEKVKS